MRHLKFPADELILLHCPVVYIISMRKCGQENVKLPTTRKTKGDHVQL